MSDAVRVYDRIVCIGRVIILRADLSKKKKCALIRKNF